MVAARDVGLAAGQLLAAGAGAVGPDGLRAIELAGDELSPVQMCEVFGQVGIRYLPYYGIVCRWSSSRRADNTCTTPHPKQTTTASPGRNPCWQGSPTACEGSGCEQNRTAEGRSK